MKTLQALLQLSVTAVKAADEALAAKIVAAKETGIQMPKIQIQSKALKALIEAAKDADAATAANLQKLGKKLSKEEVQ